MQPSSIPVCKPKLPTADAIFPYLQRIDQNRWYTNFGPLVNEFLFRMTSLFGIPLEHAVSGTNGTILLELCLKAWKLEPGTVCILPSWTFAATPLAVTAAGLLPFFVDVDVDSQSINPEQLLLNLPAITQSHKIGAVIVIAPFGKPVDVAAWDAFTATTGIPVIIDAAAAFDTILQRPEMAIGHTPMMVSLHATKVFGIGEGGLIFSTDEALMLKIKDMTQFGFSRGIRSSHFPSSNAKLSEYVAAVGLAALDNWPEMQSQWLRVARHYQLALNNAGIHHMLSSEWATSTCNIIVPGAADEAGAWLNQHHISSRKWWGEGCHTMPAFQNAPGLYPLQNTEYLRQSVLGLPFYPDMQAQDTEAVVNCLQEMLQLKLELNRAWRLPHRLQIDGVSALSN